MAHEFIARNGIVALNNSIITGSLDIAGNLTTTGTITAQKLVVQQVTSSVLYSSGSNVFGNSLSNTQSMTGSVSITGSLSVNGVSANLSSYVPNIRTLTINGTSYDLSADRSWTIAAGLTSFNTRTGAITLTSSDVTTALTFTPYNATNPSGYITGITSGNVTTALGYTPVPPTRTLTINGTAFDLSADRSWTIAAGLTSFNTRTGAITLTSADVTTALGFTPYNATNPNGYITGITSGNVTTALGYTPYNSTNPSGYITGITSGNVTTALGFTPYNATNPSSYITQAQARAALSFTAGSGAYNTTSGVITIPTNTNQLTNGSGYITGYTETSTLANVTARGATTTTSITALSFIETSTIKVKENVIPLDSTLSKVLKLEGVYYNRIGSTTKEIGLIAESVNEIYPEFVKFDENGEMMGVHYSRLTAVLIESIKELKQEIDILKNK